MDNILFVSNSNLFTTLSHLYLSNEYNCHVLNVRYSNEHLNKQEHFFQQLKELKLHYFFVLGLVKSKYDFVFSDRLANRFKTLINTNPPKVIFFEMKTYKESEWNFLQFIKANFPYPIVCFLSDGFEKTIFVRLSNLGINEVVTSYDSQVFKNVAKRNIAASKN